MFPYTLILISGLILLSVFKKIMSKNRPFSFFRFVTVNKYSAFFDEVTIFSSLKLILLPFSAFTPIILKGYSFSGIILIDCFIGSPI